MREIPKLDTDREPAGDLQAPYRLVGSPDSVALLLRMTSERGILVCAGFQYTKGDTIFTTYLSDYHKNPESPHSVMLRFDLRDIRTVDIMSGRVDDNTVLGCCVDSYWNDRGREERWIPSHLTNPTILDAVNFIDFCVGVIHTNKGYPAAGVQVPDGV